MFEAVYFPFQIEQMIGEARNKLSGIMSAFQSDGIRINQEVRHGSIGHEILSAAKDHATDLILMASHRPEMRDYFIGPNAAYVAQHASCSVLVLRKFAAEEVGTRP
jgi:nucleotide-binding universal stress UspA family protein